MHARLPEPHRPLVMSYLGVRRAVGVSGFLLPVALGPGGWLLGVPFQDNMSSYYHTPLRDVFVGTLCAMGVFLLCYRGVDRVENWTANVCCAAALGLALFPLDADSQPPYQRTVTGLVHTACGGVFFLTLAAYSLFHFPRRSDDADAPGGPPEPHLRQRAFVYRVSGVVILLSVLAMGTYLFLLPTDLRRACDRWNVLFWGEWLAVWAFAAAWLTKGRAIGSDLAVALLAELESRLPAGVRERPASPGRRGGEQRT